MLELEALQLIWWVLVGAVLIIYATTAGFDFGATMFLPFMRNEEERRVVLNVVAPTWDGNQTWIVFAGGGLFLAYPTVYATVFSGLYFLMLIILFAFFLRPPGFDYRGKINSHKWRRFWDCGLFISAFLPVLMFGMIFGNLFLGLPFYFDHFTMRSFYSGSFFELFNVPSLLCGATALLMCLMHGAAYVARRTEGFLCEKFKKKTCHF